MQLVAKSIVCPLEPPETFIRKKGQKWQHKSYCFWEVPRMSVPITCLLHSDQKLRCLWWSCATATLAYDWHITDTYTPIIFCIYIHMRRCSVAQGCFSSNTAVAMQKVRAPCWSGNCALLQAAFSKVQWRSAATSKPIGTQLPAHPPAGP